MGARFSISLATTLCLLLIQLGSPPCGLAAERPNVIVILTDDQGYGDLSCHGNPVLETPELDRLFAESTRFVDYHVAPTCSPTRAALLTGRWSNRTGVWHTILGRSILREGERTFAEVFRDAGYATGMFGKWHLGDNFPSRAEDHGFSEVLRHGGGGVGQTPDFWDNAYFDGTYWHNSQPTPVEGYCTDVWFRAAMEFIDSARARGQPFLAYIATNAPHGPMHAPPESSAPYEAHGVHLANFLGMIANIDRNVGRLSAYLTDAGLADDTIFVFTTDNGTSSGHRIFNAGMRGSKGSPYEGGHRVPLFIRWPHGGVAAGRDITALAAHVDLAPTLLDLCGIPVPPEMQFDGRSLRPLLLPASVSEDVTAWESRILFTDSQRIAMPERWRQSAVMQGPWRLINGRELYHVGHDPGQQQDVAAEHPDRLQALRTAYNQWWEQLEPTFADPCDIVVGTAADNPARLTCHDWLAGATTPWNQGGIRNALASPESFGPWAIRVAESGTYRVRLARWPFETSLALGAALPPGDPVPGEQAFRQRPGLPLAIRQAEVRLGDLSWTQTADAEEPYSEFQLRWESGSHQLSAVFTTDDGNQVGAYYVEIYKLDPKPPQ